MNQQFFNNPMQNNQQQFQQQQQQQQQQQFQQPQPQPQQFQQQTQQPQFQPQGQQFQQQFQPSQNKYIQPTNSGRYEPSYGRQYKDQLENVVKISFPSNNLLIIQLTHVIPPQGIKTPDYKEHYFFFVTLAPGVMQSNRSRNYDFQQGKTVQKFSIREIAALSFVLQQCALGNEQNVLPFSKFSNNESVTKSLTVFVNWEADKNDPNKKIKYIVIMVSGGGNKNSIKLHPGDAYAMGLQLLKLYDHAMKLEIEAQENSPKVSEDNSPVYSPQHFGGNGNYTL